MRLPLVWRILGAMILVSLLPLGVIGFRVNSQFDSVLTTSARQQLSLQLDHAADSINDFIEGNGLVLKAAAGLPAIASMDPKQMIPVLVSLSASNKNLTSVHVTDLKGMDVARSDANALANLADRTWFQEAVKGKESAYQAVVSKVTNKPVLNIAYPVKRDGQIVGVLDGTVLLDNISAEVAQIKFGKTGFAWLVDADSKPMAYPDKTKLEKQESMAEHPAVKLARAGKTDVTTQVENGKRLLTAQKLLPQGWVMVLQMDESEALETAAQAHGTLVRTGLVALLVVLAMAVLLARSLTRPIQVMGVFVGRLAQGDFTGKLNMRRGDEIGGMAEALRGMQENLRKHVFAVQNAAGGVAGTAGELSTAAVLATQSQSAITGAFERTLADVGAATTSQKERLDSTKEVVGELVAAVEQIASSATHQATEINQATEAVEQAAQDAKSVSEGIDQLAGAVRQAAEAASRGQATVVGALDGIRGTKVSVDQAAETVRELGSKSAAIGTILQEISAIAGQTNLLALNAAIEAARAGEAGRGFAVVAEEVRKLADRSVRSAQEIGAILASVQRGVELAVGAMEQGTAAAGSGAERANQAQSALEQIVNAVTTSAELTEGMKSAINSLLAGHELLSRSTQNLAAVTEENSAAAEEMAAGSETVRTAVQQLDTLALQNFAAIQGVGGELVSISQAIHRMVQAVNQLETVNQTLSDSVTTFKA